MTRRGARAILATIAAISIVALAAYLAFADVARDPVPPNDVAGLARWMSEHPADWLTASVLTDRALDSSLERRIEVWRAAHTLAARLAPLQPNASAAFVRSGLFHWYELGDADRRRVLEAMKPLLRDPETFDQLAVPLWQLTRDFSLLRQNHPATTEAVARLRDLAITNGLFEDYRALREELRRIRLAELEADPVVTSLFAQVPRPIDTADEPLIRRILEILKAKPLESGHDTPALIEYALHHQLRPLDGLAPTVHAAWVPPPLRARLALALGMTRTAKEIEQRNALPATPEWAPYFLDAARADRAAAQMYLTHAAALRVDAPFLAAAYEITGDERYRGELVSRFSQPHEWSGTCGTNEVCTSATTHVWSGGKTAITVRNAQSDDVAPYVEIYVDDALRAEGAVADAVTFEVPLGDTGLHEIEVRLANPLTRNRIQRRVALSS